MQKVGRPSKYGNKALKTAQDYVEKCYKGNTIPYIEELALILDINDDTIVKWTKKHDEFNATYRRLRMLQRLRLKQGSLEKKLQPNVGMFLLKANHGSDDDESGKIDGFKVEFVRPARTVAEIIAEMEVARNKEENE
ncbi:hypothetical protein KKC44_06125 [Patescibacteria group bacterium]|nr:hypothetical protein [Patescibacteria group bacterium]MBU2260148.1 hypothetical protein [Patescibacteria group bacterium]